MQGWLATAPFESRFKIVVIRRFEEANENAGNAFLKTLEEPPGHVKFLFATTEAEKLPVTVLSRCQRFDFAGIKGLTSLSPRSGITVGVTYDTPSVFKPAQ